MWIWGNRDLEFINRSYQIYLADQNLKGGMGESS